MLSNEKFWNAIQSHDLGRVTKMVSMDPSLAKEDIRVPRDRDANTDWFPLTVACSKGHFEIAELLLEHGADPDAKSASEDRRELGIPLHHAVCQDNFPLANLLLDHGATANGYPNCDQATIERLFYKAQKAGLSDELVRRAYRHYLPAGSTSDLSMQADDKAPEVIKLFVRFLKLGGQPPFSALVRGGYHPLAEEILMCSPDKPGTPHDYPRSSTFNNIFGNARWFGYPKLVRRARELAPERFDAQSARDTIGVAIASHNRDGSYADYREIICDQLEYIKSISKLEKTLKDPEFKPLHKMATDFCWHSNYGYKAEIVKPECYIDLAELFMGYGFKDLNYRDSKRNHTPLAAAVSRGHHPGIKTYIKFLIEQGADLCQDDPAESNPLLIAKEKGFVEIEAMLSER